MKTKALTAAAFRSYAKKVRKTTAMFVAFSATFEGGQHPARIVHRSIKEDQAARERYARGKSESRI